jgi:ABC-type lipoprotein export system ATPase subunit
VAGGLAVSGFAGPLCPLAHTSDDPKSDKKKQRSIFIEQNINKLSINNENTCFLPKFGTVFDFLNVFVFISIVENTCVSFLYSPSALLQPSYMHNTMRLASQVGFATMSATFKTRCNPEHTGPVAD